MQAINPRMVGGILIRYWQQNGFILMPVMLAIVLIATLAFLLNNQSAIDVDITANSANAVEVEQLVHAGLAHTTWAAQNSGCAADMSMTTVPFGQAGSGSYSATVTTPSNSTSAYSLSVDQDTWFRSDNITNNNGGAVSSHLRMELGNQEYVVVRFDLSTLPAGSQINSATARFYIKATKGHPEGPVQVHRVIKDWTETGATWETMATNYDSAIQATVLPQPDAGDNWIAINLTAQVQAWVNGGETNYGIMLIPLGEGTHAEYISREGVASQQPRLDVIVGNGVASPMNISVTGTLTGNPSPANDITRSLTRNTVPAYQPPAYSFLQLQSGSGKDAMLSGFYSSRNYGDYRLRVTSSSGSPRNSLLQFDVAAIPVGARVISAQLQLYHTIKETTGADAVVSVHRVSRDWVEGTSSGSGTADGASWDSWDSSNAWGTAGGDYDLTPVASSLITDAIGDWESWDIKTLVQGWLDGTFANNGLLLKGSGTVGASFASKEDADPALHPKLSITYACECGIACVAPQGSGRIALIGDDSSPDPDDQLKIEMLESWGYEVDFYQDGNSSGINWSLYDLAYVSETVISGDVSANLSSLSIGVVNEEPKLYDDLLLANGDTEHVGSSIEIIDNSHFITAIFPQGALPIYTGDMEILTADTPLAGGLQILGEYSGAASLTALDQGAQTNQGEGNNAAGRRVTLPVGQHFASNFDWNHLNANGRLMVQRAIQWGTGNTGGAPLLVYRDEFSNRNCDAADYTGSNGTLDWSPWAWVETADDGNSCGGSYGIDEDSVVIEPGNYRLFISGNNRSIARQVDLSAFTTAWLSFDYRAHTINNNNAVILEVWDDAGSSWIEVGRITGPLKDSVYASTSYDISPYISANAALRIVGSGLGILESLYIDNLQISETAPPATGPIAHWKLDETAGIIALDSVGGHDGTINIGQVWSAGQIDGALNFDGNNDAIRVPHADTLSLIDTMTFTAWVNASSYGGSYQTIIAKDDGVAGSNYYFGTYQQELVFGFFVSGTFREVFTSGLNLQAGTWYQLAASFDNATNEVRLYVDGVQVHSGTLSFTPSAVMADLSIGRSPIGEYWPGLLDDVRLYDSVLPAGEIVDLYTVGGGGGGGSGPMNCDGTFRDEFETVSYSNNDGSLSWTTDWLEINESDGPNTGDEKVKSGRLEVNDNDGGGEGAQREADLTGAGSASLTFDYNRKNLDDTDDYVTIDISANGDAGPWVELGRFEGPGTDAGYLPVSYDIGAYISNNTRIRFLTSPSLGDKDDLKFDNVEILCAP